MAKPKIPTISIEAAVARMINLDLLPADETPYDLYDYLEILCDHAEERYKNARGKTSEERLRTLELLWIACRERLKFALCLQQALEQAVKFPVRHRIEVVAQAEGRPLLNVKNVSNWAKLYFRTYITDWKPVQTSARKITSWEDCQIRINKNFKISLFNKGYYQKVLSFQDVGLWRKKDNSLNKTGEILIWLSRKKPTSDFISDKSHGTKHGVIPKDITLLRKALKDLTGLTDDPFFPLHEENNYMPRFKIIDDRRNAAERAKLISRHYEYDDSLAHGEAKDFDDEDDEAGTLIRKAEDDYR
ncbi:hypothetical protein P9J64_15130 [Deltaproteobacteria bacterium IMCC39524]|nr:hypothetical protein [Deltaproteobacteria bacterium IMCC39524]